MADEWGGARFELRELRELLEQHHERIARRLDRLETSTQAQSKLMRDLLLADARASAQSGTPAFSSACGLPAVLRGSAAAAAAIPAADMPVHTSTIGTDGSNMVNRHTSQHSHKPNKRATGMFLDSVDTVRSRISAGSSSISKDSITITVRPSRVAKSVPEDHVSHVLFGESMDARRGRHVRKALPPSEDMLAAGLEEGSDEDDRDSLWRKWLRYVVGSAAFEIFFAVMILGNTIAIGVDVQYFARHLGSDTPPFLYLIAHFFSVVFMLEIAMRITAWGPRQYFCQGPLFWNWLDLVIVIFSAFDTIAEITQVGRQYGSDYLQSMGNVRIMRIARVTRLMRIFRIGRILRFMTGLRTLVFSILSTLRSLAWAMLLLFLIIYIFAIVFTQASSDYLAQRLEEERTEEVQRQVEVLQLWWGDLSASMATLFKSVTGGISWHEVVTPLSKIEMAMVWEGCFFVYVSFTYLAVLNVLTGSFCQSAIASAERDREHMMQAQMARRRDYADKIRELFNTLDKDGSNEVSIEELEMAFGDPLVQAFFESLELDLDDSWEFFRLLDTDGGGLIDLEEFIRGCFLVRGSARRIDCQQLLHDTKKIMRGMVAMTQQILDALPRVGSGDRQRVMVHHFSSMPEMSTNGTDFDDEKARSI